MYDGTISLKEIIEQITSYFSTKDDIHTVFVYGSAAEGLFTSESDVDIAAASGRSFTPEYLAEIHGELEALIQRRVDLRDLQRLHGTILSNVLVHGKILKSTDPWYLEKRTKEMVYFRQDILPILREGMTRQLREFSRGR